MVAGKLPDLARKAHAAIGKDQLGFADAAGIKQEMAGGRIARVVLEPEPEIERPERNPAALAAPAHMDDLAAPGQQAAEFRHRRGCRLRFEPTAEHIAPRRHAHAIHFLPSCSPMMVLSDNGI